MAEDWGKAVFAARRHYEDTTRDAVFVYTNSNNTKGNILLFYFFNNLITMLIMLGTVTKSKALQ